MKQRRPKQEGEAIAREGIAFTVGMLAARHYGPKAQVTRYETNTGLQQVRIQFPDGEAYHVTVTRARR
jgi:hypothetical protein